MTDKISRTHRLLCWLTSQSVCRRISSNTVTAEKYMRITPGATIFVNQSMISTSRMSPPPVQLEQIMGNSSGLTYLWVFCCCCFFSPQSKRPSSSHRTLHKGLQLVRHREADQETPGFQRRPHIHVSWPNFCCRNVKSAISQKGKDQRQFSLT